MQNTQNLWVARLATLFGAGLSPVAPGTVGTLAFLPFAIVLRVFLPLGIYLIFTVLFAAAAVWVCELYDRQSARHDASEVVIDEAAGLLVAMAALPTSLSSSLQTSISENWPVWLAAFLLFRFFDALKPPPIRQIDRKVSGGFGVVLDDLVAGVMANACLIFLWPELLKALPWVLQ